MFSPSDYNDAVPQFTNGNYANTPLNPIYVEEPDAVNYKKGAEPLQTLPVQWWNWLWNKITAKLNNLNIYVKNIFNELAGLLSLVNVTPNATEKNVTTGQLKDMFATKYPQYLYNNFESEALLQGRTRGVIVAPTDTWNNNTNTLSLTGGFGIINTYHKVTFSDCNLVIPNDNSVHFIVSNTRGVISIQNSLANNVILIGLCSNKEYCLLIDNNPDQCKDNIILKKWFGQNNISLDFVPVLQSYYDTAIASIETNISIVTIDKSIYNGTFNNCSITIKTIASIGFFRNGTFNNCTVTIETSIGNICDTSTFKNCTVTVKKIGGFGFTNSTFNNCTIIIETASGYTSFNKGTLNNCTINIGTVSKGKGFYSSTLNNCTITIETVNNNTDTYGFSDCISDNCTINIETVNKIGIANGTYNNSTITIGTVSDGFGIEYTTLNNCTITIETLNKSRDTYGFSDCISDNCTITFETVQNGVGVSYGTYNNSTITIKTSINNGSGIYDGTFDNCTINIGTVNNTGHGISFGTYDNCTINIETVNKIGIANGTYNNSTITIGTVSDGQHGIKDVSSVVLYLTYIKCSAITSLSNTAGKLNVLNDTVFHAS